MKNKITLTVLLIAGISLTTFSGCKKYSEGPMFSFYSKTERIANAWRVDNYKENDKDLTSFISGYKEVYSTDGNYSYTWGNFGGSGTWELINNNEDVRITGTSNLETITLHILKLEEKQFWYYYMDGSTRKEFHMIQQ